MSPIRFYLSMVSIGLLAALSACDNKEDAPVPDSTGPATVSEEPAEVAAEPSEPENVPQAEPVRQVTLGTVLDLWENGEKDQAGKIFMTLDWQSPDVFAEGSIFTVSEADFTQLPPAEQGQIQQQAMQAARQIRDLMEYLAEQARQPNADMARYRKVMLAFSERLSAQDQLRLIQQVGLAVKMLVETRLTTQQ